MENKQMLKCVAGVTLAVMMMITGCEKSDSGDGSVKLPTGDDIKAATDSAQKSAGDLVASAQQQLNQSHSNAQRMYDNLKTEASQFNDEKLKSIMTSLQGKLDAARADIAKLKDANSETLSGIQKDVNAALAEVKTLYDQALARISELKSGTAGGAN